MMRERRGFTLLELMVVLILLAITAAASVPAFLATEQRDPEQIAATQVAALLIRARDAARESGATATLVLSPADGRFWITTRDSTAAGIVTLVEPARIIAPSMDRTTCQFASSGPATPCVVTVHGTRDVTVRVDEWSGDIRVDG